MKGFLAKRWHGIPISIISAVLLVCLLAGGAFAAFAFHSSIATVTVSEPMVVAPYNPFSIPMDGDNYIVNLAPGGVVRLGWDVTNNGSVALSVTPIAIPTAADEGNITTEWVMTHDVGGYQVVSPGGTERFTLKISASGGTTPGIYIFTAKFSRS